MVGQKYPSGQGQVGEGPREGAPVGVPVGFADRPVRAISSARQSAARARRAERARIICTGRGGRRVSGGTVSIDPARLGFRHWSSLHRKRMQQ